MFNIVIYGRGKTGKGLYNMLKRQELSAVFYDDETGFDDNGSFTDESLVLLSPGVKPNSKGLICARRAGSTVTSELEYCFKYIKGKCVSVTGTNGKTTTCEMIVHILKAAGLEYRLLGNGGIPLSGEVLDISPKEITVLESSSFQLDGAKTFAPYISVFVSLACDHIDYHGSLENYVEAKTNNFIHQTEGYAIFNKDDENVVELSEQCKCRRLYYSTSAPSADCYFDGTKVIINYDGKNAQIECDTLKKYAKHNLSDALAAILVAYLLGAPLDVISASFTDYKFLPHRMEVVEEVENVTFVDDSKATNVHATVNALSNYSQPLALILGGSDKGESYDDIFTHLGKNVVAVAASGDTANAIADCGKIYGLDVKIFDDIKRAVEWCFAEINKDGGVVLMSNACASFDKFNGYAERGEYFKNAVKGLISGKKTN